MGEIYKDIEKNEDGTTKNMVDNILSVGTLVEAREIKFRENEVNRVYNIMDKSDFRTVLLVGDFGSGKRSIIEGYVNKLNKNVRTDQVIEIDFNDILQKTHSNGDFSQIINDIFYVATHNETFEITLVLNNIGHLLNLNCYGNAGFSFVNTLINYIEEYNLKIIATASTDEYKTIEDMFRRVLDYFTTIKLTELTKDETAEIIEDDLDFFEGCYDMKFPKNVSEIICKYADKYIKDRVFPGKAERLFDEACASIGNKYRPADERLIKLNQETKKLKDKLFYILRHKIFN